MLKTYPVRDVESLEAICKHLGEVVTRVRPSKSVDAFIIDVLLNEI